MAVDHHRAAVTEALEDYHRERRLSLTPPGDLRMEQATLPRDAFFVPALRYPRTGLDTGRYLPDPSDPGLDTVRVVDERTD